MLNWQKIIISIKSIFTTKKLKQKLKNLENLMDIMI